VILRERYDALAPRERIFLAVGAAAVLLFLLYFLLSGEEEEPAVELTASAPATAPMSAPPPAPLPVIVTPPPSAPGPMAGAPAELGNIVLRGVMGGGPYGGAAIFDTPGGTQRVVRIGRDIAPGLVLREVGLRHAIASSGSGDVRMELGKAGGVAIASSIPASPTPAPVAAPAASPQTNQQETLQYRLGLQPVKSGGRISGYAIKPGAKIPHLGRAGLQPGDVIVSVNGSQFDEERLTELSWQIANSGSTEIEFLRGGKRIKGQIGAASQQ
jgi:general secretion pathway protein C